MSGRLNKSPLITQSLDNISAVTQIRKGHTLQLMGKINQHPAGILIDSGATTNFISQQFCQRNKLKLSTIGKQRIKMANQHAVISDQGLVDANIEVFGKRQRVSFVAVDGLKHGAILGIPWLEAVIDFQNREISFKVGQFPKLFEVLKETDLVATEVDDDDELFCVQFQRAAEETKTSDSIINNDGKLAKKIMKEFCDVFREELPDELPPKREGDHRIILQENIKPPSRAPSRMSPAELAELRDELLHKGFIRPSTSPFGAPVMDRILYVICVVRDLFFILFV